MRQGREGKAANEGFIVVNSPPWVPWVWAWQGCWGRAPCHALELSHLRRRKWGIHPPTPINPQLIILEAHTHIWQTHGENDENFRSNRNLSKKENSCLLVQPIVMWLQIKFSLFGISAPLLLTEFSWAELHVQVSLMTSTWTSNWPMQVYHRAFELLSGTSCLGHSMMTPAFRSQCQCCLPRQTSSDLLT